MSRLTTIRPEFVEFVPKQLEEGVLYVTIPYSTIILVMIFAVIAAVIAALYPAFKASRMNVLEAIATE